MYYGVQLCSTIPYSTVVLHGKVHANYIKPSPVPYLVPQRKVGTYINYCICTNTVRDDTTQYCLTIMQVIKLSKEYW